MKVPLSWLKEYLPINLTSQELANQLTMLGLEVEAIESIPVTFKNVVVGEVLATSKHPNADNLVLAKVTDGKQEYELVCGAKNCRPGIKTALALEGATLLTEKGEEFAIKKAKIRGVESPGMLCSLQELRVSDEYSGIAELPDDLQPGTDLGELYGEAILEIGLTPNLTYCASIYGVARELAAATGGQLQLQEKVPQENGAHPISACVKLSIEDKDLCPRYACRVISGIKIGPSPAWLQKRLAQAGLRSVNNVVDATNYLLLELGHPLHAFDLDKLEGKEVAVRRAKAKETITTLDGKERQLEEGQLVIADKHKPAAIAGVMGGADSEVSESTTAILLESAYFNPSSIRKTSKQQGLQTDASKRFERGADPEGVIPALDRAAALIQELAGGQVAPGILEVAQQQYIPKTIECRATRVEQMLGIHLSLGEIESLFQRLGFKTSPKGLDSLLVTVPTYRVDIFGEIDLIEEVARLYGYDNFIGLQVPHQGISELPSSPLLFFNRQVRSRLIAEGLQEFLTCDLISPTQCELLKGLHMDEKSIITLLNPVSIEQSILRPSLLPGLLQVVKYNFDHQNFSVAGFEIGRVHFKEEEQFQEREAAGIVMTGFNGPAYWGPKAQPVDFFDMKGIIENVFHEVGMQNFHFGPSSIELLHTGRQAAILLDGHPVGYMGEIHPAVLRTIDLPQKVYYAEFNLHALLKSEKRNQQMKPLPIYPGSERDWTITLRAETPIDEVLHSIRSIPSTLLEDVYLLDLYTSDRLGKGRKNATFHFVYRDPKKTVSQEEVDTEHAQVTENALQKLGKNAI